MMYYITVTAFETLRLRQRKSYVLTIRLLWRAPRRCGGTGRRTGLKILRDLYSHTGSIPVAGIISRLYKNEWILILVQLFCVLRWERVWRICICVGRKLKNNDKS
jgi:hypothetical protein